jgi:hypothetical protein
MEKKVVSISKISKQIEFDRDVLGLELDQTSKINTFTNFSPNPVIKSVTPKPSESVGGDTDQTPTRPYTPTKSRNSGTELEQILNDIDNE